MRYAAIVYQPPWDPTAPDDPALSAPGLEEGSEQADADAMRGNGPIGLGQLADGAAHTTWTLARSRSPLVGPAAASVARAAPGRKASRKAYRKAYRRAAKHRVHRGGLVIR